MVLKDEIFRRDVIFVSRSRGEQEVSRRTRDKQKIDFVLMKSADACTGLRRAGRPRAAFPARIVALSDFNDL
jgi:hypothetical protein